MTKGIELKTETPKGNAVKHFRPGATDGLPIRGYVTAHGNVDCGWANPSYICRLKLSNDIRKQGIHCGRELARGNA